MTPDRLRAELSPALEPGTPHEEAFERLRALGLDPVFRAADFEGQGEPYFSVDLPLSIHGDGSSRLLIYLGKGAIVRSVLLEPTPTLNEDDGVLMVQPVLLLGDHP